MPESFSGMYCLVKLAQLSVSIAATSIIMHEFPGFLNKKTLLHTINKEEQETFKKSNSDIQTTWT